ncbi:hypothetical protein RCL1_008492 [Eukaryota sp. TZLM3-RCL]
MSLFSPLMGRRSSGSFQHTYSALPMVYAFMDKYDLTGNIILPEDALRQLADSNAAYPYMFRIENKRLGLFSHAGIAEFTAKHGEVYIPGWMMNQLHLNPHDRVDVSIARLPKGEYVRLQPQSVDFLEIENPKAVLEFQLRQFKTFTVGDVIKISFSGKIYDIAIKDLKPADAVSLIDTDIVTEFDAPVGYVEDVIPTRPLVDESVPQWVREFGYNIRGWGEEVEVPKPPSESMKAAEETYFAGKGHSLRTRR